MWSDVDLVRCACIWKNLKKRLNKNWKKQKDVFQISFRFCSVVFPGRPEAVKCKLCAVLCARVFPAYGHKRPLDGREKKLWKTEKQHICFSCFHFFVFNVRLRGGRRPVQRPPSGAPGGPSRGSSGRREARAEATVWGLRRPVQRPSGGDNAHMFAHMKCT